MELSKVSVTLYGENGCGLFFYSVLEIVERAIGRFFGGRCFFGHVSGC